MLFSSVALKIAKLPSVVSSLSDDSMLSLLVDSSSSLVSDNSVLNNLKELALILFGFLEVDLSSSLSASIWLYSLSASNFILSFGNPESAS